MTVDDDEGDGDRGDEGDNNNDEGDGDRDGDGDEGDDEGDDGHESCTHNNHGVMTTMMWPQWTMDDSDDNVATEDDDDAMPMVNAMA